MKLSTFLIEVKSKIDTPEKHATRTFARDAMGADVSPAHSSAVCFCTLGAMMHVVETTDYGDHFYYNGRSALRETLKEPDFLIPEEKKIKECYVVHHFNDTVPHNRLMDLFDRTIARLQGEDK